MARIKGSGNKKTELELARLFKEHRVRGWRRQLLLRVTLGTVQLRVRPDFVFPAKRIVVFVDGEFWHGHRTLCRYPQTRRAWWAAKIDGNKKRDRRQTSTLRAAGWTVIRIWQSEVRTARCLRKLRRAGLLQPIRQREITSAAAQPNVELRRGY
jgi:DNA mismatch endonuclease (patch repair protein)